MVEGYVTAAIGVCLGKHTAVYGSCRVCRDKKMVARVTAGICC